MIDHDRNVGQLLDAARRARHRRGHDRHLQHRQRPARQHLARRRDHPVPQREGHQLGGRVPRARDRSAGPATSRPASVSNEIVQHHDWLPTFLAAAGDPDIVEKLKTGHQAGDKTFRVHIDGYNLLPYLTGEVEHEPAARDSSTSPTTRRARHPVRQLEDRVHGAAQAGHAGHLGRAVHRAARAEALQPAHRPVRARRHHVEHLLGLVPRPRLHRDLRHRDRARRSSRRSRSSRPARSRPASRSTTPWRSSTPSWPGTDRGRRTRFLARRRRPEVAIEDFVARVCDESGPDYVPPDGTRRGGRQRRHAVVREADAHPARLHDPPARPSWPTDDPALREQQP